MLSKVIVGLSATTFFLVSCSKQEAVFTQTQAPSTSSQIVNGIESPRGSRPYMVHLPTSGCGGFLVSNTWVMTAAHCIRNQKPSDMIVRVGLHSRQDQSDGDTIQVAEIHQHPKFLSVTKGYDIAMLKLSQPITHKDAAPIALPSSDLEAQLTASGRKAVVSGWGFTKPHGPIADKLRETNIPITANPKQCSGLAAPANTICGEPDQGKDSCNGDSGGPLTGKHSDGKWYALGIVSYGPRTCDGNGTYTRINGYLDWIKQTSGIEPEQGNPIDPVDPPKKTYKGTVNTNSSSFQPNGTKGFHHKGGTLQATLSSSASGDFDLYLQKRKGGCWIDVGISNNEGHHETITYDGAEGVYRWEVYAYEGQGDYTITLK